uniref:Uncharacterized protein n=1 Tax=Davidia involucrata TaxID=16924 RepID=A0A5B7A363_DAVIN
MEFDRLGGIMAPGTDGGCCKESISAMEDENHHEKSDNSSQAMAAKPPRNLSVMRHSISHAMLAGTTELESTIGIIGLKSPSGETSGSSKLPFSWSILRGV